MLSISVLFFPKLSKIVYSDIFHSCPSDHSLLFETLLSYCIRTPHGLEGTTYTAPGYLFYYHSKQFLPPILSSRFIGAVPPRSHAYSYLKLLYLLSLLPKTLSLSSFTMFIPSFHPSLWLNITSSKISSLNI